MDAQDPFARFAGFRFQPILEGHQPGLTRRDPSPVIRVGGRHFVWYSRTAESLSGYPATIWFATSPDGFSWREEGEALGKGAVGAFDEYGVFTPTILVADGRYHLIYTAVPVPFDNGPHGTGTAIGIAVADDPAGPWRRLGGAPVLRPSEDPPAFDSMRVDDACVVARQGGYWLYYKGRGRGRTPRETKMGLAIASRPEGPYTKHRGNPVLDGGHEVCVWPHGSGVGTMVCNVGPEGNTLQYADDGVHFRRICRVAPPQAPGPYREDHFRDGDGPGIRWGICMASDQAWPYLLRFDCDLRAEDP